MCVCVCDRSEKEVSVVRRVAAGGVFRGEAVSCRCVFLSCDSSSDELMCLHWQPAIVTIDIYVMYIYLANKLSLYLSLRRCMASGYIASIVRP